ncbi:hypothetical protein Mal64_34860 [Pseudobythopirellula maris]|uniref:Uncharacterized protein n=1 Tax=Pseudobythopirellula maris TaxID=2527991 RepID=A0A5C5ZI40_9BACT|nr:PEP-CTERM sorting domain-containing protein [Pseudobythopirellula maris]TWT86657.1 hypothetical protein Mal64_34860 [Pseudobythopirellula maris]
MKSLCCSVSSLALLVALAAPASAAPTVDGTVDGSYGAPLAVQTVQTNFGDSTGGVTGGGELDAAYATVSGDRLYVMITGNIENNFNKLSLFIDSKAGGENTLSGGPSYDGGVSSNFAGLTFDTGFEADYHVFGRWGGAFEVDVVDRAGGACTNDCLGDFGAATVGAGTAVQSGTVLGDGNGTTSFLSSPAEFGFNNNNAAGVGGGTGAVVGDPASVTTGFEFSIALADIGSPVVGSEILIHAAYGNGDNNFHSNQILGGLAAPQDNLGGDGGGNFTGNLGGIDFNQFAGAQYFSVTVVPEPGALMIAMLAVCGFVARRRA